MIKAVISKQNGYVYIPGGFPFQHRAEQAGQLDAVLPTYLGQPFQSALDIGPRDFSLFVQVQPRHTHRIQGARAPYSPCPITTRLTTVKIQAAYTPTRKLRPRQDR